MAEVLPWQEIAAIRERNAATRFVLDVNRDKEPEWWYRCHETQLDGTALLRSHNALRAQLEDYEETLRFIQVGFDHPDGCTAATADFYCAKAGYTGVAERVLDKYGLIARDGLEAGEPDDG